MTENRKTPLISWARLAIGFILFCGMGAVWTFVAQFEAWLFVIPAILMGIDPRDLLKK